MASGDITTAQIGSAVPLAYGAVRATGMKLIDYTTSTNIIVQAYGLAEGEWDGIDSFFANGINIGQFSLNPSGVPARSGFFVNPNGTTTVHFHPGTDTPIGSSLTVPASVGTDIGDSEGDQLLDAMWSLIPAVVNPLTFSRLAYYFISFNPNVTSTGTAATTTSSTDLSPIADFRTTKCRIFDADGNQTDYRYTLNAAWHFVDSWLRRVIQPEYNITLSTSNPVTSIITPLTSSQRACFDWSSIAEAAAYYDYVLLNGRPRFQGSYAFASTTTLAAIHEQILLCCRSYQQEYAGKISLMCDKPRPSTFLFDERHLVPGTFTVDQQEVHGSANRYISNFLDLGLPVINTIATISRSGGSSGAPTAVITTTEETPAAAGDVFEVAGVTDATFDDIYTVTSASDSTIQAVPNYPQADASSTGGAIGYPETRFAARTPEINHRQAQLAAGQITSSATENATRLNRTQVTNDFASSTYDQQNRLLQYEMIRALGPDVAPWKPPATINVSAYSESIDDFDQVLKAQIPGDRITLTDRVTWEYAGDYEVMERYLNFFNWNETDPGSR